MRDAPSIPIVSRLVEDGARVRAYDPKGMNAARSLLPIDVLYCNGALQAADDADAVVIITEWNEFRAIPPARLREAMRGNTVVDLRNIYDPHSMLDAGFDYHSVGRPGRM